MPRIEFIGLPGVGKTTIANEVASLLRKRGADVAQYSDVMTIDRSLHFRKIRYGVRFVCFLISNIMLVVKLLLALRPLRGGFRIQLWRAQKLLKLLFFYEISPSAKTRVQLLDQGILQCIWTLGMSGADISERSIRHIMSCMRVRDIPDAVIFLNSKAGVVRTRYLDRGYDVKFIRLLNRDLRQVYSEGIDYLSVIRAACFNYHIPVFSLDTSKPIDHNSYLLVEEILGKYYG